MAKLFRLILLSAAVAAALTFEGVPVRAGEVERVLADLSLEDLLKVEVSLASRNKEALSDVAGAASMVTAALGGP